MGVECIDINFLYYTIKFLQEHDQLKRPIVITIIAGWIIFCQVLALIIFLSMNIIFRGKIVDAPDLSKNFFVFAAGFMAIFLAYGLLRLREWARMLLILAIMSSILSNILIFILNVIYSIDPSQLKNQYYIIPISIILSVVVIYYLATERIKNAFK